MTWTVRLRSHAEVDKGAILETAHYTTPKVAMAAYRALLGRADLVGRPLAAVFKPPADATGDGNVSTFFSRFDCRVGDGRIAPDDARLDPLTRRAVAEAIARSLPPEARKRPTGDWEDDPRPLGRCLKDWHALHGWTRAEAAAQLRVPPTTYDGFCAGKPSPREAMIRRMMTLIDGSTDQALQTHQP